MNDLRNAASRLQVLTVASLGVLAAVVVWLGAAGLRAYWSPASRTAMPMPIVVLVVSAWLALWLASVARSLVACAAGSLFFIVLCSSGFASKGVDAWRVMWSMLLAGSVAALARNLSPDSVTWPSEVARWRRALRHLTVQLDAASGCVIQLAHAVRGLVGRAAPAPTMAFEQLAAVAGDIDAQLQSRFAGVVVPEELRLSLNAAARDLVTHGELARLELGFALEHRALREAVLFRDRCALLADVPEIERDDIARRGHQFLLDLSKDGKS